MAAANLAGGGAAVEQGRVTRERGVKTRIERADPCLVEEVAGRKPGFVDFQNAPHLHDGIDKRAVAVEFEGAAGGARDAPAMGGRLRKERDSIGLPVCIHCSSPHYLGGLPDRLPARARQRAMNTGSGGLSSMELVTPPKIRCRNLE